MQCSHQAFVDGLMGDIGESVQVLKSMMLEITAKFTKQKIQLPRHTDVAACNTEDGYLF